MFLYELLDSIADSVNLFLGAAWITALIFSFVRDGARHGFCHVAVGLLALCVAYGLMWADSETGAFGAIGLDYSTHTAVAAALSLALVLIQRRLIVPVSCLLLGYFALMLYQQYHTVADILVTLIILALPYGSLALISLSSTFLG